MTPLNVRAVIFDMDGLVLDSESTYTRAWQEAAHGLGFSLSDDFVESLGIDLVVETGRSV